MKSTVTHDEIRSDFLVRAPRSKVWSALTTEEGWTGWFSDAVEGRFEAGEVLTMEFKGYGKGEAHITTVSPEDQFAFRWHPGDDQLDGKAPDSEMTLVKFDLEDHADGTWVSMVESGFGNLSEDRRLRCIGGNTEGWDWELDEFVAWLESGIRQSRAAAKGD